MVIKKASLDLVCGITSQIPNTEQPEIAFAGKSNVGKSTLINALMNRKSLARTSSQPGKTQTLNFYHINDEMYLVDLPGYGYANANIQTKAKWGKMIENYLFASKTLKAVFLLVDIRHEPSENDKLMYKWVSERGYEPVVIATKLDKIKRSQVQKQTALIKRTLGLDSQSKLYVFSSQTKQGRDEIWSAIEEFINVDTENGKTIL